MSDTRVASVHPGLSDLLAYAAENDPEILGCHDCVARWLAQWEADHE